MGVEARERHVHANEASFFCSSSSLAPSGFFPGLLLNLQSTREGEGKNSGEEEVSSSRKEEPIKTPP